MQEFWQPGPTGTTGTFLGVTGAVTGPAFFGTTGATGPTGAVNLKAHVEYLYNRARTELLGASDAAIRTVMYEVFHEFFNDSSCWLEAIPGILQASVQEYWLEPGNPQSLFEPFPKGEIIGLASVIEPTTRQPWRGHMPIPPILTLYHAPSNAISVYATVIKNVRIPEGTDLPHVPYWVVRTYETWLLAGIKGKMLLQADRPYSDLNLGKINYGLFRQGVNIARVRALKQNTFGASAWAFPQQFRTSSQRGGLWMGSDRRF
jgi:hypothetical protein